MLGGCASLSARMGRKDFTRVSRLLKLGRDASLGPRPDGRGTAGLTVPTYTPVHGVATTAGLSGDTTRLSKGSEFTREVAGHC